MVGNPSRLVLRDAMMAVLKTQELAGFDLVTDGELMRFDPSHPETNGMIDYFIARMDGIRNHCTIAERARHRADRASGGHGVNGGSATGSQVLGSSVARSVVLSTQQPSNPATLVDPAQEDG